jgi:adenine deaminase
VPGFIDTHLHIESSLVTPFEFDRCVTPRGITTAICDPHEIANVIGADGIRYFQEAPRTR